MSLRFKLLLLALLTLALPWAGCQYAYEMETVLREGERQSMDAVARTVATSLQGRPTLLFRDPAVAPATPPLAAGRRPHLRPFDVEPLPLASDPLLDGYADDWPRSTEAWRGFATTKGDRLRVLTGVRGRFLYVLVEMRDAHIVFDAPGEDVLEPRRYGDRVWIGFDDPGGAAQSLLLATTGPGAVRARRIETRAYGQRVATEEPRVEGAWREMQGGYRVEARLPLSMVGPTFGVLVDDRDRRGAEPVPLGSLGASDLRALGRLVLPGTQLDDYLSRFAQPGVRLEVASVSGALLAVVDPLPLDTANEPPRGLLAQLYRRLIDRGATKLRAPRADYGRIDRDALTEALRGTAATRVERSDDARRVVVAAVAPVFDDAHRNVIGVVQVAQTADRWLLLRDRALTSLVNLTLGVLGLSVFASLAFAARLAWRLARLRRATDSALTREGEISPAIPELEARDELGDLARGFSSLLGRVGEYTGYLRTLAGKLAHEIRTPLTIVRSSLDNLESEGVPDSARAYVARAREGSERLAAIVQAMGAASRVEEAIGSAERIEFDLVPVVASATEAYRDAFPGRQFRADLPHAPCGLRGAPDLIVQMLDKLVDNAVDFSPPGSTIVLRVSADPSQAVVEVENSGPALPPDATRLFESLWQSRRSEDGRPHFGLGLYIVRLIAAFHRGVPFAENLADGSGVRIGVRLER